MLKILENQLKYDTSFNIKTLIGVKTGGYYLGHLFNHLLEKISKKHYQSSHVKLFVKQIMKQV